MKISLAASLAFAAAVAATNPKVVSPGNMTYTAGDMMEIKWDGSTTGYVNIDLVDAFPDVLQFPMVIAQGVSGEAGKYSWKIPSNLKTASGYCVRVWGSEQPRPGSAEGLSSSFTLINDIPNAVNTFVVTSPSKGCPCAIGTTCKISWDFPSNSQYPAMVDLAVYKVGNPAPYMEIATVDSSLKSYSWAVPNDPILMSGDVYISVSGQGVPLAGPGMSNNMGGNSPAFAVQSTPPPEEKKSESEPKVEKKKEMPKPKPEPEAKVKGSSQKQGNAATTVRIGGAILAAVVLSVPLAQMFL